VPGFFWTWGWGAMGWVRKTGAAGAAEAVVAALLVGTSLVSSGAWAGSEAPIRHDAAVATRVDFRGQPASQDARALAQWSFASGDTQGRPFAVVDKKDARLFVFSADGRLVGAAPALLGLARGDDSAPGVGRKVSTGIPREERTTPAGRFESEPGHNISGEAIVWIDYDAAVAIHRIRPTPAAERRPQRLASETPADNRISLGCVVVDAAFYDQVVGPTLGRQRGVVYVLPETRDWRAQFGIGQQAGSGIGQQAQSGIGPLAEGGNAVRAGAGAESL
jgi:hypothetical protein